MQFLIQPAVTIVTIFQALLFILPIPVQSIPAPESMTNQTVLQRDTYCGQHCDAQFALFANIFHVAIPLPFAKGYGCDTIKGSLKDQIVACKAMTGWKCDEGCNGNTELHFTVPMICGPDEIGTALDRVSNTGTKWFCSY